MNENPWNPESGTAGGAAFAAAVRALAAERGLSDEAFAAAAGFEGERFARVLAGEERVGVAELARIATALKLRAVEFLQTSGILSLEVYAGGLDPLFFVPAGTTRHDARIYMREINPRHRVPERDMLGRNPTLKALLADELLDALGRLEVELTYLLRAAVIANGGAL